MSKILLIDDEPDLLETLGVMLKAEGHDVVAISDGLEAMSRIQTMEEFDVMCTDLRMAPIDGMELIALARKEHPTMSVMVVSAYLDDKIIERLAALGCAGWVRKPFSMEEVLDPLREILVRREQGEFPKPPGVVKESESAEDEPPKPPDCDGWVL